MWRKMTKAFAGYGSSSPTKDEIELLEWAARRDEMHVRVAPVMTAEQKDMDEVIERMHKAFAGYGSTSPTMKQIAFYEEMKITFRAAEYSVEINDIAEKGKGIKTDCEDKLSKEQINQEVVTRLKKLGLEYDPNTKNFEHKNGLVVAAYEDKDTGKVYLAYIGYGNKTKDELFRLNWWNGWGTNAGNTFFGFKEAQYTLAIEVGEAFKDAYKEKLVITGQSLGGGFASVAGLKTGLKTITFNAAGPNYKSAGYKNESDFKAAVQNARNITAYCVKGEFVWALTMEGGFFEFAPDPIGQKIYLEPQPPELKTKKYLLDYIFVPFKLHEPKYIIPALMEYMKDNYGGLK
ncbi:MAG: hypothetical protein ACP5Q5_02260 [Brevinematia bacterium]